MSMRIVKKTALMLLGVIALGYLVLLLINLGTETPMTTEELNTDRHRVVAVFGATGTIGDGLLKAAMNDPDVERIHAITRRPSPRIEEGVASGKVAMTTHRDYLDYSALHSVLAEVDAVYWAIGLSSAGMDEAAYREIHADYPLRFVREWLAATDGEDISFHYVSGAGANSDSRMMWAREKANAEAGLAALAEGTALRVVSYRPSFIMPTEAEAGIRHRVMFTILRPIGAIAEAEGIGRAMLEVSARGRDYRNGTILENRDIVGLSSAYEDRRSIQ